MSQDNYPRFLCDLLDTRPAAGQGVHPWLFRVARYLHRYHTPEEICSILEQRVADCGRPVEPHEVVDAVKNSSAYKWEPSDKSPSRRRAEWLASPSIRRVSAFNPEFALRAAARIPADITPEWLKTHSPVPVCCSTGEFLQSVFQSAEKVLVFDRYKSQGHLWPDEVRIESFTRHRWPEGGAHETASLQTLLAKKEYLVLCASERGLCGDWILQTEERVSAIKAELARRGEFDGQ